MKIMIIYIKSLFRVLLVLSLNFYYYIKLLILLHYKVFNVLCIAISILFFTPLYHIFISQIIVIN